MFMSLPPPLPPRGFITSYWNSKKIPDKKEGGRGIGRERRWGREKGKGWGKGKREEKGEGEKGRD